MRWLVTVVLAGFLGAAALPGDADAQVFKPRGKGSKSAKSSAKSTKSAKSSSVKKSTTKRSGKSAAKSTGKKRSKGAGARPSDLTPDPVDADADEDYVEIVDLDDSDW